MYIYGLYKYIYCMCILVMRERVFNSTIASSNNNGRVYKKERSTTRRLLKKNACVLTRRWFPAKYPRAQRRQANPNE